MSELAVGIDIGGTNTVLGFVDKDGKCIYKTTKKTTDYVNPEVFVEALTCTISDFFYTNKQHSIAGIGIGAPNGNYYKGTIEFAPNLKWKGVVPIVSLFQQKLKTPVILTNDANAAAIGEMIYGNARGMNNFILITLGTGVGSGIVVDGNLVYGHDGFAGEIGHAIVYPNGRLCGCGRKGCLEAYCSAQGITTTYMELLKEEGILDIPKTTITPLTIYEKAKSGESTAIRTYEKTGETLGLALANSVAFTSPEAIFLFGGISNAGDFLLIPTKKNFEKNLLVIYRNKITILLSGIRENDAAVLGAASLIWKLKQ